MVTQFGIGRHHEQAVEDQRGGRRHLGISIDQRDRVFVQDLASVVAAVVQFLTALYRREVERETERRDCHPARQRHPQCHGPGPDAQHEADGDGEYVRDRLVLEHKGVGYVEHQVQTDDEQDVRRQKSAKDQNSIDRAQQEKRRPR